LVDAQRKRGNPIDNSAVHRYQDDLVDNSTGAIRRSAWRCWKPNASGLTTSAAKLRPLSNGQR
jgi:hypothetical protein